MGLIDLAPSISDILFWSREKWTHIYVSRPKIIFEVIKFSPKIIYHSIEIAMDQAYVKSMLIDNSDIDNAAKMPVHVCSWS
jgi:hypothetical protein